MKIFCKSVSGSQPYEKVPGRKKPERAQVHKKSKMFFKKRVLQLQKMQKMRVLRVSHVCCVCCVCCVPALRVALRVFAAREVLRTVVCYSFSHETFIFSGRKSGV